MCRIFVYIWRRFDICGGVKLGLVKMGVRGNAVDDIPDTWTGELSSSGNDYDWVVMLAPD